MDLVGGIIALVGALGGVLTGLFVGKRKKNADADSTIIDNAKKIIEEYEKLKELYGARADALTLRIDEMQSNHDTQIKTMEARHDAQMRLLRDRLTDLEKRLEDERKKRAAAEERLSELKQKYEAD